MTDPFSNMITKWKIEQLNVRERNLPIVTWTHSWSIGQIQNALIASPFKAVPPEIMLQILKFLSVSDLCSVSLVCRQFKMIADQDDIWKLKCKSSTKLQSKSFKQIYMDWMHEKYLRNRELEKIEKIYREQSSQVACGIRGRPPSYPVRPAGKHHFVPIGGFTKHPNESEKMSIELSIDIDRTAPELISLLEKASRFQNEWRQSSIIKQMITRYYRFMQLKATCPNNILLIPTLDIEIMWQTHLLRPEMYREDCIRLFHRVIDHSLLATELEQFLKEQAFLDTCKLYEDRFGEQYCPLPTVKNEAESTPKYIHPVFGTLKCLIPIYLYWDETCFTFSSNAPVNSNENPFSFTEADFTLDGNWLGLCKKFMREMLLTIPLNGYYENRPDQIDLSKSAIMRLKKSYERFLYIAAKYPPSTGYSFVHPTYAIDIIWHSHMQEPLKYVSDCMHLVDYVIDHTPWPSVDENKMKHSCDDTKTVWRKEFDSDMTTDHLYNTKKAV